MNTIVMAIEWPYMSKQVSTVTQTLNYFFSAIFLIEAVLKLIGLGTRYFKDNWNIFDFTIVITSMIFFAF